MIKNRLPFQNGFIKWIEIILPQAIFHKLYYKIYLNWFLQNIQYCRADFYEFQLKFFMKDNLQDYAQTGHKLPSVQTLGDILQLVTG